MVADSEHVVLVMRAARRRPRSRFVIDSFQFKADRDGY